MGESSRDFEPTDDQLLFLKKQQEQYHEGSVEWTNIQAKINQIIAENYLQYVNR